MNYYDKLEAVADMFCYGTCDMTREAVSNFLLTCPPQAVSIIQAMVIARANRSNFAANPSPDPSDGAQYLLGLTGEDDSRG